MLLKWSKSRFVDLCKRFFLCGRCKGVLGIIVSHNLANRRAAQYINYTESDAPGSASKLIAVMHNVEILIALPCPHVTFVATL